MALSLILKSLLFSIKTELPEISTPSLFVFEKVQLEILPLQKSASKPSEYVLSTTEFSKLKLQEIKFKPSSERLSLNVLLLI